EIEKANVIIHLQDARAQNDELDTAITQRLPARTPVLKVFNKIDLLPAHQAVAIGVNSAQQALELGISAKTGAGLDTLRQQLLDIAGWSPGTESPWLARERHLTALQHANEHLTLAEAHASQNDRVLDLFAEELRLAHDELCLITGQFTSDDLLGEIFSSFCLGK